MNTHRVTTVVQNEANLRLDAASPIERCSGSNLIGRKSHAVQQRDSSLFRYAVTVKIHIDGVGGGPGDNNH